MRKNLSLLIRVLSLALIVSLVFSCRKQNVKQVNIDNQFAISIFSDTIKIGDLLNNMDSTVSGARRRARNAGPFISPAPLTSTIPFPCLRNTTPPTLR